MFNDTGVVIRFLSIWYIEDADRPSPTQRSQAGLDTQQDHFEVSDTTSGVRLLLRSLALASGMQL